ncbi:hypothetical protein L1987_30171 [Smallanthus sonchifolius]|uniref:Uncharacterized protein n=1 Tax=Smallanthus sonchifolius TaxID=185202 RepID=A0ACB9I4Q2_9ASTR|nr:hypothetical protein L1987_30171 [Smallanthus sonchifolius]
MRIVHLRFDPNHTPIGFLYLRFAAKPKTLWGWFEPYVKDDEVRVNLLFMENLVAKNGYGNFGGLQVC